VQRLDLNLLSWLGKGIRLHQLWLHPCASAIELALYRAANVRIGERRGSSMPQEVKQVLRPYWGGITRQEAMERLGISSKASLWSYCLWLGLPKRTAWFTPEEFELLQALRQWCKDGGCKKDFWACSAENRMQSQEETMSVR